MCANIAFADRDSPSRRRIQRFRLANGKHIDVKDVKVALDIIVGPSLQFWKLGVARGIVPTLKRAPKLVVSGDNVSSTSETPKKKVRFDEKPVKMSRKWFFERYRKNSSSSPPRPCLVIRERDDVGVYDKPPEPPVKKDADCHSVYEDSLSYHPDFVFDMQILQGNDVPTRKHVRRSDFYEIEDGVAVFDRAGYANYCLSKWLDKQREEAWAPKKRVFEDSILLPSQTLSQPPPPPPPSPSNSYSNVYRPVPLFPAAVSRPPRSLPLRICKYIEDEFHNAIFVLTVGLFIHLCLYLFLLYDVLTRGLFPSDD